MKGITMENTAPTMHNTRRKRVFSGCVHSARWYIFSVTLKPRLAANRTSVAPDSVFFIWLTGVFTNSMIVDVTCYV